MILKFFQNCQSFYEAPVAIFVFAENTNETNKTFPTACEDDAML